MLTERLGGLDDFQWGATMMVLGANFVRGIELFHQTY